MIKRKSDAFLILCPDNLELDRMFAAYHPKMFQLKSWECNFPWLPWLRLLAFASLDLLGSQLQERLGLGLALRGSISWQIAFSGLVNTYD